MDMNGCSNLAKMSPTELSYLTTTIAVTMARNLDSDTAAVLSSFFFGIGSTLGLISRQRELIRNCRSPAESTSCPPASPKGGIRNEAQASDDDFTGRGG